MRIWTTALLALAIASVWILPPAHRRAHPNHNLVGHVRLESIPTSLPPALPGPINLKLPGE